MPKGSNRPSPIGGLELVNVTFGHDTAATVLFRDLCLSFHRGWTGIVGVNGGGKTTLLELIDRRLTPWSGHVAGPDDVVVCPQRTDDPPDGIAAMLEAGDRAAHRLRSRLGIDLAAAERWSTLSHGERKRAQIGVALWRRPAVLALDEPTNHLDSETRQTLGAMLRRFDGIGLVVSHDRALLDMLCGQCLLLDDPSPVMRPGGYSNASDLAERDAESDRRTHDKAAREQKRIRAVAADRRHQASLADRQRSKRGLRRKDHDGRSRIDAARVSGKDGQAGRLADQLEGRLERAEAAERSSRVARRRALGMTMRGEPARCDALWQTDGMILEVGGPTTLELPVVSVRPGDRIGIGGANGSGKSTLIRHITGELGLPAKRIVLLPQEIDRAESQAILGRLHGLPSDRRGDVLATIDCLGSDPTRLLETEQLSPGEVRKLVLALGLARTPHMVVMDEPTNHLDLPSIECLEQTLQECRAAMLLVSHDAAFLDRTTTTRWHVDSTDHPRNRLRASS